MDTGRALAELRHAAEAGVAAAAGVLDEANRELLSVPAPLALTRGGVLRAATRAAAGAPPRLVTGRLQVHANSYEVSQGVWFVGVFAVPYARRLEFDMNHPYASVALAASLGAMGAAASAAARESAGGGA